jgi:hypothetical protein
MSLAQPPHPAIGIFQCSGITGHHSLFGALQRVLHVSTLGGARIERSTSASLNPTQPSKTSKGIYTYQLPGFQYQSGVLIPTTLVFQSSHFAVPIIQEHSTAVIVLDKPPISFQIPQTPRPSKPDQTMSSPIYHRPRGPLYTTRTNSGTNYQVSSPFYIKIRFLGSTIF